MPATRDGGAPVVSISGQAIQSVIVDPTNPTRRAEITPMGEMRVAPHVRLVGTPFHGTSGVDPQFWGTTTSGIATVVQASGNVVLSTSDASGSLAMVQSARVARYVAGVANYYRAVVQFDAGVSGNIRRWGMFNSSEGMFFEMNQQTPNVVLRKAGIDQTISSQNFISQLPTDSYYHTYEIYVRNRGVDFACDDTQVYRHTISSEPYATTLSLPVSLENRNTLTATTSGIRFKAMSSTINRMGEALTRPIYSTLTSNSAKTFKLGPGTIHRILINNNGVTGNRLVIYDGTASGVGPVVATIDTTATPAPVNFDMEMDFFFGLTAVLHTGTPADTTFIYE